MDKPHKRLDAWKLSMLLAEDVYQLTKEFPKNESFGLTAQIRRSAISISSNIAEGAARRSRKEFVQYLYVAKGSLSELDTQWDLAQRLNFIDGKAWKKIDEKMTRIDQMISGLVQRQKRLSKQGDS